MVLSLLLLALVWSSCSSDDSDDEPAAPPEPRTIAFLRAVRTNQPENQQAFLDELAGAGYVAGDNLTLIAERLDEVYPDPEASEAAARRWASEGADLIIALSTTGARSAIAAAPSTPVLFLVNDPVAGGLVDDLRHPSGNATGATFKVPADRTLDLIRRAIPRATRIGIVYPPADPAALAVKTDAAEAASAFGVTLVEGTFTSDADAPAAVDTVRAGDAAAVWVLNSPTSVRHVESIAGAATAAKLPVVTNTAVAAAVLTLEPDAAELYRQIARQALRLFEGADVAEIPVENPSKFMVEVNVAAAANVGLRLPDELVDSADRVVR